jgi:prepilin-type N-terminal cleavage/methylation domain-containing protein
MESLNISTSGKKGFTLIEIVFVIALAALVFTFSASLGFDAFSRNYLRTEQDTLLSVLQKARNEAVSNLNDKRHGFRFDGVNYVIFEGDTYLPADPMNLIVEKNPAVNLSGSTEVIFERLTGDVLACDPTPCNITLTGGSDSITISINGQGRINW